MVVGSPGNPSVPMLSGGYMKAAAAAGFEKRYGNAAADCESAAAAAFAAALLSRSRLDDDVPDVPAPEVDCLLLFMEDPAKRKRHANLEDQISAAN